MTSNSFIAYLGREICNKRLTLGYSQEHVGELAGLHRTYISDVERGQRNATVETLLKIACALNTKPSELLLLAERKYFSDESKS